MAVALEYRSSLTFYRDCYHRFKNGLTRRRCSVDGGPRALVCATNGKTDARRRSSLVLLEA